ncbi:hypothetical protein [Ruminococcus sp.]|nr:hypothetical protein [Ruminococcus sp.]
MKAIKKDPFEEYIKNLPPTRREMGEADKVSARIARLLFGLRQ